MVCNVYPLISLRYSFILSISRMNLKAIFQGSRALLFLTGVSVVAHVLSKRKRLIEGCKQKETNGATDVGLLILSIPTNFREVLKNDFLIEESVKKVRKVLYVYIARDTSNPNAFDETLFVSNLYNNLWEVASYLGKLELDFRIIPSLKEEGFTSFDQLLLEEQLSAVFGEDSDIDITKLNVNRLQIEGRRAITFHPLSTHAAMCLYPNLRYFEDPSTVYHQFGKVIMGGTFDHLHNGHKKLLFLASRICKHTLVIGITADHMLRSKSQAYMIQSVEDRKQQVRDFLHTIRPCLRLELPTIHDGYGPAITLPDSEAIVVSTETIKGALKINDIRQDRKLERMEIFVCRRTEPNTLSSSYIRSEISRKKRMFRPF